MKHAQLIIATVIELVPPRAAKWIGLACLLLAYFVPRFFALSTFQSDAVDHLIPLGAGLLLAAGVRARTEDAIVATSDQRGNVVLGFIGIICAVGAVAFFALVVLLGFSSLTGCGSTQVRAERSIDHRWKVGPPCDFRAIVDGVEVYHLESELACPPPPEVLCPVVPETTAPEGDNT